MENDSRPLPTVAKRRYVRSSTAAAALVVGLATLTAEAIEGSVVRDIQRYCTVCWKNARLDPGVWDDCTQEVCYRLLDQARSGRLDLTQVLAEDSQERRQLVRAIDMVRKRVQRARRLVTLDEQLTPPTSAERPVDHQVELAELLETARRQTLTERQDRIVEMWTRGWTVPEIAATLKMTPARVSDEKYKALRRLERFLSSKSDEDESDPPQGEVA
jgi:hypothetical protein